ncbi:hypothetical protein LUZ60_007587 [Juncus effusus]|nr:hypothetical protein LUZ60_007587 [Juncus effusus]
MAQQLIEANRDGAEIFTGHEICKKKSLELLEEVRLPRGLLPLSDMEEVGYNRSTGFVWLRQKNSKTHNFKKIGKNVSYAKEVTAFVEDRKMKRMTGVKSKEILIWITLTGMAISESDQKTICFTTPTGLGRSFPVSAFEDVEE